MLRRRRGERRRPRPAGSRSRSPLAVRSIFSVSWCAFRSRWAPTSNRCRQRRCHLVTLLRCDESASSAVISSSWQIASSTRSTGGSAASMSSRRVCSLSRSLASGALPACTRSFSRKTKFIARLLWRRAEAAGLNPRLAMLAIVARAAAAEPRPGPFGRQVGDQRCDRSDSGDHGDHGTQRGGPGRKTVHGGGGSGRTGGLRRGCRGAWLPSGLESSALSCALRGLFVEKPLNWRCSRP